MSFLRLTFPLTPTWIDQVGVCFYPCDFWGGVPLMLRRANPRNYVFSCVAAMEKRSQPA